MNHALIINLAIIAVVVLALILTLNPMCLFGLFLLREMPYGLLQREPEEEEGRPIGFVHPED